MKLSSLMKRYLMLIAASFLLISVFQNCGQPGSIAKIDSQKVTDLDDGAIPTPPPPPPGNPVFKDYQKSVKVNASTNKVDVLVVVDNSGSMSAEQANMASRFSTFMNKLNGLDWQVGIVTTDVQSDAAKRDGRLLPFADVGRNLIYSSDMASGIAQSAFAKVIQRPASEGSGNEQGVKATYRALERALEATGPNVGLIRNGAALSVIVVTDADETVAGNDRAGDVTTFTEKNKPASLVNFINTQFPGKTFKFNSIIVRDGDLACLNLAGSANEGYGKNYQSLTTMTSGILGSVCESDYGNQLSIIGDNTAEIIRVVTLDCAPVDSDNVNGIDLVVKDANNNVLTGYALSGRVITFNQQLPVGDYQFAYRCKQ